jgi:hypothetical protein
LIAMALANIVIYIIMGASSPYGIGWYVSKPRMSTKTRACVRACLHA